MLQRIWVWMRRLAALGLAGVLTLLIINGWVYTRGAARMVESAEAGSAQAIMVLGAYVYPDGRPSPMLQDRLEAALALYEAGKAPKILVTGDHGQAEYDEVNAMRRYLEARGVPTEDIFMDHAGFDTYNSMYRARDVFGAERILVVTQRFHLPRALYLGRSLGLEVEGVTADRWVYADQRYYEMREMAARFKAFAEVALRRQPVFLGEPIPITGDGRQTHDD